MGLEQWFYSENNIRTTGFCPKSFMDQNLFRNEKSAERFDL